MVEAMYESAKGIVVVTGKNLRQRNMKKVAEYEEDHSWDDRIVGRQS